MTVLLIPPARAYGQEQPRKKESGRLPARIALPRHVPALDGLRALAVAAVVAFHFGVAGAKGGLLGVDVFFVLSGFLITSLLLDEQLRTGRIGLVGFWGRRARRLLPALRVVITTVVISWRWLGDRSELGSLQRDAFSTLAYVANWRFAFSGQDYFGQPAAQSPLLHTWSLGIEEQFYVLWPVVAILVLRLPRGDRALRWVAVLGAFASTALLIVLSLHGANPSRLYYGTDTRVAALLVGAAIATLRPHRAPPAPADSTSLDPTGTDPTPPGRSRWMRVSLDLVGLFGAVGLTVAVLVLQGPERLLLAGGFLAVTIAAVAVIGTAGGLVTSDRSALPTQAVGLLGVVGAVGLVIAVLTVQGQDPILYHGGFLVVALAAGAVIVAAVGVPTSPISRLLALPPLRLLGRISYGVYLWHWPVLLAVTRTRSGLDGPELFLLRVAVTLVLAAVSYRLIELPVRHRTWQTWPRRTLIAVAVIVTVVAVVLGTGLGVRTTPGDASELPNTDVGTSGEVPATTGSEQVTEPAIPARPLNDSDTAPRTPLGRRTRVLLAGDSIAATLGWSLGPVLKQDDTKLFLDAPLGCGILAGKHIDQGLVISDPKECAGWQQRWRTEVAQEHPDVVAVLVGRWEMTDRYYAGAWRHLGDPVFDAYVRAELEQAVASASSSGAQVALLNPPCLDDPERPDGGTWPQDDPARAQRFRELQQEVTAEHQSNTQILDLAALICPNGQFQRNIDGIQVRRADGVHFTAAGARWVGRSLLPELTAIAEEAKFRVTLKALAARATTTNP